MGLGAACRCGRSLTLATEVLAKRCDLCAQGIQLSDVAETVGHLVQVWEKRSGPTRTAKLTGSRTAEKVVGQAVGVVGQGNRTEEKVVGQDSGGSRTETKQQRWKRKNAEKMKDLDRVSKQRRRTGNEA